MEQRAIAKSKMLGNIKFIGISSNILSYSQLVLTLLVTGQTI